MGIIREKHLGTTSDYVSARLPVARGFGTEVDDKVLSEQMDEGLAMAALFVSRVHGIICWGDITTEGALLCLI